jgi:hypothetical protein
MVLSVCVCCVCVGESCVCVCVVSSCRMIAPSGACRSVASCCSQSSHIHVSSKDSVFSSCLSLGDGCARVQVKSRDALLLPVALSVLNFCVALSVSEAERTRLLAEPMTWLLPHNTQLHVPTVLYNLYSIQSRALPPISRRIPTCVLGLFGCASVT